MNLVKQTLASLGTTLRIMSYNKVGFAGFLMVIFIVLMSFVGPYFIPLDTVTKVDKIFQSPSAEHWFGTDHQGRDIFSQIIHGGKDVIVVAVIAGVLSTLIAVTFGTLSGFAGGRTDAFIMAITDVMLTIPQLPLLLILASLMKFENVTSLGVLLGLLIGRRCYAPCVRRPCR